MASMPAKKPRSLHEEFLAVPRHLVAEIIHGELRTHPRPASPHARASSKLGMRLGPAFDDGEGGPGGWLLLDEPELHLQGSILVPDLAGWRRERMPEMPVAPFFELAPDWICEVLSPSTEAEDRADKMPIYVAAGVGHAWLVDPIARTLEAFRRDGDSWRLVGAWRDYARVRVEPFDAMELELGALWAR
ncbi:MAG: Uma2 family endonuclease [Actinobacteria bacterium]|nr:Uma2 family endonuclease [Actinomycetota bacterium]